MADKALQDVLGFTQAISGLGEQIHGAQDVETRRESAKIQLEEARAKARKRLASEEYLKNLQSMEGYEDIDTRTPEGQTLVREHFKETYGDKLNTNALEDMIDTQAARSSLRVAQRQQAAKEKLEATGLVVGDALHSAMKGDDSELVTMGGYISEEFPGIDFKITTKGTGRDKKYILNYNDVMGEDYVADTTGEVVPANKTEEHTLASLATELNRKLQNAGPLILKGEFKRLTDLDEKNLDAKKNRAFYLKDGHLVRGFPIEKADGSQEFVIQDGSTGDFTAIPGDERDFINTSEAVKVDDKTNDKIQTDLQIYREKIGEPTSATVKAITYKNIGLSAAGMTIAEGGKDGKKAKTPEDTMMETMKMYGLDPANADRPEIIEATKAITPWLKGKDAKAANKITHNYFLAQAAADEKQEALESGVTKPTILETFIGKSSEKVAAEVSLEGFDRDAYAEDQFRILNTGTATKPTITKEQKAAVLGVNPEEYDVTIKKGLGKKNNNPGNLREPGKTTGYRKFDTPEEGFAALVQDIKIKQTGQSETGVKPDSTLEEFINVYSPKHENQPAVYVKFLADKLPGVTKDTPIKDIDAEELAKAIAKFESGTEVTGSKLGAPTTETKPTLGGRSLSRVTSDILDVKRKIKQAKSDYKSTKSAGTRKGKLALKREVSALEKNLKTLREEFKTIRGK